MVALSRQLRGPQVGESSTGLVGMTAGLRMPKGEQGYGFVVQDCRYRALLHNRPRVTFRGFVGTMRTMNWSLKGRIPP
jgi:hypothetical protein